MTELRTLAEIPEFNDLSSELLPEATRVANNGIERPGIIMQELVSFSTKLNNTNRRLEELHASVSGEIVRLRSDVSRKLDNLHTGIKRIAVQPVIRLAAHDSPPASSGRCHVRLPKCPLDLFEPWNEYEFGRGGIKPAKHFTRAERGANKSAYCRHKILWDVVIKMVRRGHTSDGAIDTIYSVFGRSLSVTQLLVRMRTDRARGGHPDLR